MLERTRIPCQAACMTKQTLRQGNRRPDPIPVDRKAGEQTESPQRETKNPAAVALGRLGGLKGGRARAERMSKEERSLVARAAAQARWAKK